MYIPGFHAAYTVKKKTGIPMSDSEKILITDFDILTCGTGFQMLKAYLPYVDCKTQRILAILIRMLELSETLKFYDGLNESPLCKDPKNMEKMLKDISRFCPKKDFEILNNISNISKMSEMYNTFSHKDNMFKSFMNEDQQKMYDNYKSILDKIKL